MACSYDLLPPGEALALFDASRNLGLVPKFANVPDAVSGFAAQIAHELGEPRPCPRSGTPPREVRELRAALFQQHPELDKRREPALGTYVKNMCSVLGLLGYRATMLTTVPELSEALAAQLKAEYYAVKELGIPPSAISRRAHLWTFSELQDLVTRAPLLFDADKTQRPKSRMMIDLVMRGVHPDIDSLHARYREIVAESKQIFGADPETASVAGMAASLVIRKDRASITECYEIYKKALRGGERIAKRHEIFEPIVRTMAGFVMSGRYDSMAEAWSVYRKVHADVEKHFADFSDAQALIRTTVVLIIKGSYKSARHAHEHLQKIHTDMEREVASNPDLAGVSRSLELLVYSKNYKTCAQVALRYRTALAAAEKIFEVDEFGRSLAKTAAHLVVQMRYKSVAAVHRAYRRLMKEAVRLCGPDEEGAEVAKTLVLSVLKGTYPSISEAREVYLAALADCEKRSESLPGVVRSAALLILRNRFRDGAEAVEHFRICQRQTKEGLKGDPVLEPLVTVFAGMLFRDAIPSIPVAKARYLEILDECNACFNSSPDSNRVNRTAALLVFRRVYPNAQAAHAAYLEHLEAARAEYNYKKDAVGQDAPGIRSMAMKLFESRIHALAA